MSRLVGHPWDYTPAMFFIFLRSLVVTTLVWWSRPQNHWCEVRSSACSDFSTQAGGTPIRALSYNLVIPLCTLRLVGLEVFVKVLKVVILYLFWVSMFDHCADIFTQRSCTLASRSYLKQYCNTLFKYFDYVRRLSIFISGPFSCMLRPISVQYCEYLCDPGQIPVIGLRDLGRRSKIGLLCLGVHVHAVVWRPKRSIQKKAARSLSRRSNTSL